jgi:hypothetical protein
MDLVFFIESVLFAVGLTSLLILVGRKIEKPFLPVIAMALNIGLLVYNTVTIEFSKAPASMQYYFLAVEFLLLLVSFIAFLWLDSMSAKKYNLKSYDDSLDWFWKKI